MVTNVKSEIVARIFKKKPRVGMASGFLTIRVQSSRFSKIRKFVPLIIFNCEPIFHVIRVLNFYVCQKTVPAIFEKNRLSLSLLCLSKLSLKVENGHPVQHRAPPVLRRAGAPGLSSVSVKFNLKISAHTHVSINWPWAFCFMFLFSFVSFFNGRKNTGRKPADIFKNLRDWRRALIDCL